MPLIVCKDKRNQCGIPFPSTCVSYEGEFNGILKKEEFTCNVNINDIIYKISDTVKILLDKLELLKQRVTVNEADINSIKLLIQSIQATLSHLDVNSILVNIDLKCLAADAAPCQVGTNSYTLLSLLQLFVNEICLLKA